MIVQDDSGNILLLCKGADRSVNASLCSFYIVLIFIQGNFNNQSVISMNCAALYLIDCRGMVECMNTKQVCI